MFVVNNAIVTILISTLKLYHASPRPSWESSEVSTYKCYSEFGSPSGHTMMCTNFCIYIYFIYVVNASENNRLYKRLKTILPDKAIKFSAFMILAISTYYMGYSRILLGAHSINQVLYGFFLGLWTGVWFIFIVRKTLLLHLADIRDRKLTHSEIIYFCGYIFSILVIMNLVQVWFLHNQGYESKQKYLAVLQKCDSNLTEWEFDFENFWNGNISMLIFGAYTGFIFKYYYLERPINDLKQSWTLIQAIQKILIILAPRLVMMTITEAVPSIRKMDPVSFSFV